MHNPLIMHHLQSRTTWAPGKINQKVYVFHHMNPLKTNQNIIHLCNKWMAPTHQRWAFPLAFTEAAQSWTKKEAIVTDLLHTSQTQQPTEQKPPDADLLSSSSDSIPSPPRLLWSVICIPVGSLQFRCAFAIPCSDHHHVSPQFSSHTACTHPSALHSLELCFPAPHTAPAGCSNLWPRLTNWFTQFRLHHYNSMSGTVPSLTEYAAAQHIFWCEQMVYRYGLVAVLDQLQLQDISTSNWHDQLILQDHRITLLGDLIRLSRTHLLFQLLGWQSRIVNPHWSFDQTSLNC